MKRDVLVPTFPRPDGTTGAARVRFELLGSDGRPILAQLAPDGTPVTGLVDVTVHADPVTIQLHPTDEIVGDSFYRVTVRAGRAVRVYDCQFAYSAAALEWAELIGSATPLEGAELDAWLVHVADDDRHLMPGDRAAIASASQLVDVVAGEVLGGNRLVRIENGQSYYASSATQAHAGRVVGITTGAAAITDTVSVQTQGAMTEPSWSWSPGPIYLGVNGALTQTPPTSGFLLIVGRALSATKILIGIQTPVLRN